MRGDGMARPGRTHFASHAVAHRDHDIDLGGAGGGEFLPTLRAQMLGGDTARLEQCDRHRMDRALGATRSEEHTSELQSLMRISYAVFCLKKKTENNIKLYESKSILDK